MDGIALTPRNIFRIRAAGMAPQEQSWFIYSLGDAIRTQGSPIYPSSRWSETVFLFSVRCCLQNQIDLMTACPATERQVSVTAQVLLKNQPRCIVRVAYGPSSCP